MRPPPAAHNGIQKGSEKKKNEESCLIIPLKWGIYMDGFSFGLQYPIEHPSWIRPPLKGFFQEPESCFLFYGLIDSIPNPFLPRTQLRQDVLNESQRFCFAIPSQPTTVEFWGSGGRAGDATPSCAASRRGGQMQPIGCGLTSIFWRGVDILTDRPRIEGVSNRWRGEPCPNATNRKDSK